MDGISRRLFIQGAIATGLLSTVHPGLVFANAKTERRLVVVILRGGMDGLAAVAPYGDPDYAALRGDIALSTDSLLRADDLYGFHPSLQPLFDLYQKKELAVIHAAASPYRERSHFDAQNVLELGSTKPNAYKDGWLNRVVSAINTQRDGLALSIGQSVPLIMRGKAHVGSWAPSVLPETGDDFMSLVGKIYGNDKVFAEAFSQARMIQDKADHLIGMDKKKMTRASRSPQAFVTMAKTAGKWLAEPDGPRIATLELGGWDTHAQQGTEGGRLANNFGIFARGVDQLREALGPAWSKTAVIALTEFGRTARANGDHGTDHGTGSAVFVMGGAVKGGRVISDWPGLSRSRLYEERDLRPTTDIRSITKGVLRDLYGIPLSVLNSAIYPQSAQAQPVKGLIV